MDSSPTAFAKYAALAAAAYLSWRFLAQRARRGGRPLPPGPTPLPLLGNIRDLPTKHEWLTYADWTKQYGEIVYVEVLGQPIVILGSLKAATELFERRGANCSDRPQLWMQRLCGADWPFSSMRYGDAWRVRRKAFHTANLPEQVLTYQPGHFSDAALYLRQLLLNPTDFRRLSRWYMGAVIMRVAYGLKVQEQNDPYIDTAERLLAQLGVAVMPGRFLVEFMPLLRFVPEWFPGAEFQRFAARTRTISEGVRDAPWTALEAALARGEASASMGSKFVEVTRDEPDRLEVCKDAAANAYLAGSDTTVTGINNFVVAMVQNPEVQAHARAEIDAVVGRERLPTFEDRPNLPYLHALVSEVFRWKFIAPMGVPHATIKDEEYNGYHIPAGTMLLANSWWFMHDPEVFEDPEAFIPERFLRKTADGAWEHNPDVPDPRTALFGYGRRRCPGLHIAEQSLWAAIASMLATLTFGPATSGSTVPEWNSGMISSLRDFSCDIRPRDSRAEVLVHESAAAADAQKL